MPDRKPVKCRNLKCGLYDTFFLNLSLKGEEIWKCRNCGERFIDRAFLGGDNYRY